jgi:uncharacterized protein
MSVQYDVSALLKEPVGSSRHYEVDSDVPVDDREPQQRRVTGSVTFLHTRDGVLVTAHLQGTQSDGCSRCLLTVDVPVGVDIEEEFFATVDAATGAALPAPEDADAFRIDADQVLDLEEAVRQGWTVALPMQPLCQPDCRGLCPRCGRDLNKSTCSCGPEDDEQWSALRGLASEMKGR